MIGRFSQIAMPLSPGTRLGHYDVTALLGEGGMGQVWQTTDTQLGQDVAVIVQSEAFTALGVQRTPYSAQ